jgi:nucleoside-diphosphate-sugar epimerase
MFRKKKPATILLTGASGFIGKFFIDAFKEKYDIIALARRSSTEAGVPFHPNIRWIQWNIANESSFKEVMEYLLKIGGADIVVHLAGYYDYEYDNNPEYERTNIRGTEYVLELAKQLKIKHFIFASSLAACNFPEKGKEINEDSPADADFAYAVSKSIGEDLCQKYSAHFKCSVIRFAAIFSDWCEYGPLYQFIQTWVSGKWDSKVLGGKGNSAISYLHIHDLTSMLEILIEKTDSLEAFRRYIASPNGSTTHRELYTTITRDFFGFAGKPLFVPALLTFPGLIAKKMLGKFHLVSEPFEKFWMLKYIDLQLNINADKTYKTLGWQPTPRYHIIRRMIFLLDKMKSHPTEWLLRNEAATKRKTFRPNLLIYEFLIKHETEILKQVENAMVVPENYMLIPSYLKMSSKDFRIALSTLFNLLLASVRSGDRMMMKNYISGIAEKRFNQNFAAYEVVKSLEIFQNVIMQFLLSKSQLRKVLQEIYDYIGLTMQLAIDEVEDVFYTINQETPKEKITPFSKKQEKERQEEIKQLSAFYQEYKA